jgi:NADPH-dependent F420 reductase
VPGGFDTVLVVDFGAQYAQLIARRVREHHVYSEIVPSTMPVEEMLAKRPKAIILSGGPSSVYADGAPPAPPGLFDAGVPVLGICYGFQLMVAELGGTVERTGAAEYGRTVLVRGDDPPQTVLIRGDDPPQTPPDPGGKPFPPDPLGPPAGGCRRAGPPGWDDQFMTERETPSVDGLVIGILGGTGDQGRGLARRFALAGHSVIIGSRSQERAHAAAQQVGQEIGNHVRGLANAEAAREASVVIAAVPWEGHGGLLSGLAAELAGKIVVDCVNPLGFDQRGAYPLPVAEGSAAEQAAALLPGSRVVAAFHHVSAVLLLDPEIDTIDLDVLVLGDDREATDLVQALAARIPGVRGIYAGRLRNCGQIEALTANLVSINRRYKAHAGLRITDI